MRFQLPNGLLEGGDLFNFCVVDELRGKQQNYLMNVALIRTLGHIPKILSEMVLSLETATGAAYKGDISKAVLKLPAGDVETMLIKIRENTYGPRYFIDADCQHCGKTNKNQELDLSSLELDIMPPEEMVKPKILTLPKSGRSLELKYQTLADLEAALKLTESESLLTDTIFLSLKSIDGNDKFTRDEVEKLPMVDINYMEKALKELKLEGSIDNKIEFTCEHCKKEAEVRLNTYTPDFFFHTGDSMSSNT